MSKNRLLRRAAQAARAHSLRAPAVFVLFAITIFPLIYELRLASVLELTTATPPGSWG